MLLVSIYPGDSDEKVIFNNRILNSRKIFENFRTVDLHQEFNSLFSVFIIIALLALSQSGRVRSSV